MFIVKKQIRSQKEKLNYLIDNLALIKNQKFTDAIESMSVFSTRRKIKLTDAQESYLDIMISHVDKFKGNADYD